MTSHADNIYGSQLEHWRLATFGSLIDNGIAELQTGPFGTALAASEYRPIGTPVIAVQHIADNRIAHFGLPRVDAATRDRLARYELKAGDILFARKGAVERRALVRAEEDGWLQGSDCIRLRLDPSCVSPVYISYALGTPQYRNWIIQNAHGATMPSLNQEILRRVPIPLPSLAEQRAIASILGALDDKIELNRRMNVTLEAMARAIFQSWFVDFDPVRAKAEGRETGLPAEIAALFPDGFVESELGEIPQGWRVGVASDVFDITMGQSPPGTTYNDYGEGLPFFQGRADFTFRFPKHRVYCTAPTRFADGGHTLVSVRAPVGDVNMASERCAIGRGVASVRSKSGGRAFAYYSMQTFKPHFEKFEAGGTVFGSISKKDFHNLQCIVAVHAVLNAFEVVLRPIDDRIDICERESASLAALRDTLLPKLISGQLRVPETENLNEESVA